MYSSLFFFKLFVCWFKVETMTMIAQLSEYYWIDFHPIILHQRLFNDRINYAWCLVNLKVQILFDSLLIKSFSRPLKCTVPITFKRTTALNNTRPRVIKMKPINSIRHKYKPQLTSTKKPPESREELYKYKPKFAIRNILHRSRHGRLNKLLSNISI